MKLRITKHGAEAIDAQGNPATIAVVELVYDGGSLDELRVHTTTDAEASEVPVWTIAVPLQWVEDAFARAFYFEGGPIPIEEVFNGDSEIGAIARDEGASVVEAGYAALRLSLARRAALLKEAAERFAQKFCEELPALVQRLLEDAVEMTRDAEERAAGVRLPWSGSVQRRRKRGAKPGKPLDYYLLVRARKRRTGKSLLTIFAESLSEDRAKARYYEGQKVFLNLNRRR